MYFIGRMVTHRLFMAYPIPKGGYDLTFVLQNDHLEWGDDYLDPLSSEIRRFTILVF